MYERSAIVLERYLNKLFGFDREYNLINNLSNFKELIEEVSKYQVMVAEEEKVIARFEDIAKEIQSIQKTQEKLSISNQKLEEERKKTFTSLDENPNLVQRKLEKIETKLDENNEKLKDIREEYIKAFIIFMERQKERVKFAREKREIVANHITIINKTTEEFKNIQSQYVQKLNKFIDMDKQVIKNNIVKAMIRNGKNEKVGFDETTIDKAVDVRLGVLSKEAECYLIAYERVNKLLSELENDNVKINKYEKIIRDISAKIAFLEAEKKYIVEFLDNERIAAMSGIKMHEKMMNEACKNFDADIRQINNLYELILKEITGKSTKKAYEELYNKTYLRNIQENERSFEREISNMKLDIQGALINSNYWRVEGIKNVYEVFEQEVTEKFDKDLSSYKLEELPKNKEIELFSQNEEIKNEETNFDDLYDDDFDIDFYEDEEDEDNEEEDNNIIIYNDSDYDEKYEEETENDDYDIEDEEDEKEEGEEEDNYIYSLFKEISSYNSGYEDKLEDRIEEKSVAKKGKHKGKRFK